MFFTKIYLETFNIYSNKCVSMYLRVCVENWERSQNECFVAVVARIKNVDIENPKKKIYS